MAAWAIANKVSLVSVGAAGGKRLAHRVDIDDLSLVTHDPLLAQLRYRLRKEHGAARKGKMGVACTRPLAGATALPSAQGARRGAQGQDGRGMRIQPRGRAAARRRGPKRRQPELPWLRVGRERDLDLRPVRSWLGARQNCRLSFCEGLKNHAIIQGFAALEVANTGMYREGNPVI